MLPDKLFIVDPSKFSDKEVKDPTYCAFERQDDSIEGVEYILKDALLEWLNERYKSTISNVGCYTGHSVWGEVIEHLNEMRYEQESRRKSTGGISR